MRHSFVRHLFRRWHIYCRHNWHANDIINKYEHKYIDLICFMQTHTYWNCFLLWIFFFHSTHSQAGSSRTIDNRTDIVKLPVRIRSHLMAIKTANTNKYEQRLSEIITLPIKRWLYLLAAYIRYRFWMTFKYTLEIDRWVCACDLYTVHARNLFWHRYIYFILIYFIFVLFISVLIFFFNCILFSIHAAQIHIVYDRCKQKFR